jgi:SAM-dependent methyltransferase
MTGNRLRFDGAAATVRVEHSDLTYPILDGIIDLCPESHDRISASYDKVANRYDPYITSSTVPMRVVGRIFWGFASDRDPMDKVLALLPDRFDGVLLDVPVGTGVFTASLYSRARFMEQGIVHVPLLKADAANLPVRDGVVDTVLSMNGWHAFVDKQRTVSEIRRVLRKDGRLVACGYIQGARRLSDWFVRYFGVRNSFFTPPFFRFEDMDRQFRGLTITRRGCDKSFAWFEAVNNKRT